MSFEFRQGDVLDVLRGLPSNHFSGCLTDPPYGLSSSDSRSPQRKSGVAQNRTGFMGLEWDGVVPGPIVWRELLRTMRPGAHLLAFGGSRTHHRLMCAIEDSGFDLRDTIAWITSQGFPKSYNLGDGYGTALKPALEMIVLARKPLNGTVADNIERWNCGGLAIDACRVPHDEQLKPFASPNDIRNEGYNRKPGLNGREGEASAERRYTDKGGTNFAAKPGVRGGDPAGRWPANVILDEESAQLLDAQTGTLTSGANPTRRKSDKFRNTYSGFEGQRECIPARGADSGGASRFYYVAKVSPSERAGNNHPTLKPVKLTEYLARLILPKPCDEPRRIIIPYSGSGSEALGAAIAGWEEGLGIEANAEYIETARRRLAELTADLYDTPKELR